MERKEIEKVYFKKINELKKFDKNDKIEIVHFIGGG